MRTVFIMNSEAAFNANLKHHDIITLISPSNSDASEQFVFVEGDKSEIDNFKNIIDYNYFYELTDDANEYAVIKYLLDKKLDEVIDG